MTSTSLNTKRATTDALEEADFDPNARQIDSAGRTYRDFHAALAGEIDRNDPCNERIEDLVKAGRTEAFCREYRKGYEGAVRSILAIKAQKPGNAKSIDDAAIRLCCQAALNRACETYPLDGEADPKRPIQPEDVARAAGLPTLVRFGGWST